MGEKTLDQGGVGNFDDVTAKNSTNQLYLCMTWNANNLLQGGQ